MDLVAAPTCTTWSAVLQTTAPVGIRHYCLMSNQRFVAPPVSGACLLEPNGETAPEACNTCSTFDGEEDRENCNYLIGSLGDLGREPPALGYDEYPGGAANECLVGFDSYFRIDNIELQCSFDSVMVVEIIPPLVTSVSEENKLDLTFVPTTGVMTDVSRKSDRVNCTSYDENGANGCFFPTLGPIALNQLAALTFVAYQPRGNCEVVVTKEQEWRLKCRDNGPETTGCGGAQNQLQCEDLPLETFGSEVLEECGLDSVESLNDLFALLIGLGVFLGILTLGFLYAWRFKLCRRFYFSVALEAFCQGIFTLSVFSIDWNCLADGGFSMTHNVLFPYANPFFWAAEMSLILVAFIFQYNRKGDYESFDEFKFDRNDNVISRLLRAVAIGGFGVIAGYFQFVSICASLFNRDNDNFATNVSWIIFPGFFGGFNAFFLFCVGAVTGNYSLVWKVYKATVGDFPGIVLSATMASSQLIAWVFQLLNDISQTLLSVFNGLDEKKAASSQGREVEYEQESDAGEESGEEMETAPAAADGREKDEDEDEYD